MKYIFFFCLVFLPLVCTMLFGRIYNHYSESLMILIEKWEYSVVGVLFLFFVYGGVCFLFFSFSCKRFFQIGLKYTFIHFIKHYGVLLICLFSLAVLILYQMLDHYRSLALVGCSSESNLYITKIFTGSVVSRFHGKEQYYFYPDLNQSTYKIKRKLIDFGYSLKNYKIDPADLVGKRIRIVADFSCLSLSEIIPFSWDATLLQKGVIGRFEHIHTIQGDEQLLDKKMPFDNVTLNNSTLNNNTSSNITLSQNSFLQNNPGQSKMPQSELLIGTIGEGNLGNSITFGKNISRIIVNKFSRLSRAFLDYRQSIHDFFESRLKYIFPDESEYALVRGVFFGDDAGISKETNQLFMKSGLIHLLSASGGNIHTFCMIVGSLVFFIQKKHKKRILLLVVFHYGFFVGENISFQRASIARLLTFFALPHKRVVDPIRVLFFTLFILYCFNPFVGISSRGLLLSVGGVWGILHQGVFLDLIKEKIKGKLKGIAKNFLIQSFSGLLTSFFATLGVLGPLLYVGGIVNFASILFSSVAGGVVFAIIAGTTLALFIPHEIVILFVQKTMSLFIWIAEMSVRYGIFVESSFPLSVRTGMIIPFLRVLLAIFHAYHRKFFLLDKGE